METVKNIKMENDDDSVDNILNGVGGVGGVADKIVITLEALMFIVVGSKLTRIYKSKFTDKTHEAGRVVVCDPFDPNDGIW